MAVILAGGTLEGTSKQYGLPLVSRIIKKVLIAAEQTYLVPYLATASKLNHGMEVGLSIHQML